MGCIECVPTSGACTKCENKTYSDGLMPCTDKCPAFSSNETTCKEAGFCLWNSKYRVCYAEQQQTFTEITVTNNADMEKVVEVLEQGGNVVVVVEDEEGRKVVMVYGDVDVEEAKRELNGMYTDINTVDAAYKEPENIESEEGMSKGVFVGVMATGGIAILGLVAAIVATLVNIKGNKGPISL